MSRIVDSFRKEQRFSKFEGNTCGAKEREYVPNVYNVFFWWFSKHDAVVYVDRSKAPLDGG